MKSPKTQQLDIDLWPYDQLNNQMSSQMSGEIRRQMMLAGWDMMRVQIYSQMDEQTRHKMEDIAN